VLDSLQATLKALPARPGVYIMHDQGGAVIYVGKAINLRNRVRSYFHRTSGQGSFKIKELVLHIAHLETIVTESELEALILECNLIKKHRPKYNIRLKDDKNYLYVKIDVASPWPRVYTTRRVAKDGARYFGPYASARSIRATLDVLKRIFPYRSCDMEITGQERRPCLDFHIHRCLGPCIGAASPQDYAQVIQQVVLFLEGKSDQVAEWVHQRMTAAAEAMDYERAAVYRDQLAAIRQVIERQKVLSTTTGDEDVIAFARDDGEACAQVFFIRAGKLIGREHFVLQGTQGSDDKEVMGSFLQQFYDSAPYVPGEIVLQIEAEEMGILQSWLKQKRGSGLTITVPQEGEKRDLVNMVAENAAESLAALRAQWLADAKKTGGALVELQQELGLPTLPTRIECYDISNISGTSSVGSMVVFDKGVPRNSEYRRFKIKTVEGANDFASLQEVLRRRFKRLAAPTAAAAAPGAGDADSAITPPPASPGTEPAVTDDSVQGGWAARPGLLIVDGGKGQLSAAREVMEELGVGDVPTVGLAKEHEEIFLPGRSAPVLLPRTSQGLYLVQRIRDEAHRFALAYHQRLRKQTSLRSALDEVTGIGPRRKSALLKQFGTVAGVRAASVDELMQTPGMTRPLAELIKELL
jgi:excinuclease ABC subunit C